MKSATLRILPLGIFAVAAVAGCAYATETEDTAHVADARLETRILASLDRDPRLHAFDISVSVAGSKAVLAGSVDDDVSRKAAEHIARDQAGIESVVSRIVLGAPPAHTTLPR